MRAAHVFIIASVLTAPLASAAVAAASWSPEKQAQQSQQEPSQLGAIPSINPEVDKACDETAKAIEQADWRTSSLEEARRLTRRMQVCNVAHYAALFERATRQPLPGPSKRIKPDLVSVAAEAIQRILAEFNQHGPEASFSGDDLRVLSLFSTAVAAGTVLDDTARSSAELKRLDPQLVRAAKDAAERVLAEFNQRGSEAKFDSSDEETIREFSKALDKDE